MNSTIFANRGAHTITNDKVIKRSFSKNNITAIKNK